MKLSSNKSRLATAVLAALAISGSAMAQAPDPGAPYILYLRSDAANVDNVAIARTFIDKGFDVTSFFLGDDQVKSARLVSKRVRQLLDQGVSPERINVLGNGASASVAVLASAMVANRDVNYVLLGQCDPNLKEQYNFTMSGHVMGIYDHDDAFGQNCRLLWNGSPRVSERKRLVTHTGLGASLFDSPHEAWTQPVIAWVQRGGVNVGEISVGKTQSRSDDTIALADVDKRDK